MSEAAAGDAPRWLHDLVTRLAAGRAEETVIGDPAGSLSGAGLAAAVAEAEAALRGHGLGAGDRVPLLAENSVAAAVLVFALSRLGAWPVILNPRLTPPEIEAIAAHCGARCRLYATALSPAAAALAERDDAAPLPKGPAGVFATPAVESAPEPEECDPARAVAALIYTSGTTGRPKGVMLTHANLLFIARVSAALRRLGPADRVYGMLPISHVFGLASVFLGSLHDGARLDLVPRFEAGAAARALAEDGITIFQGVPALYGRLLELAARRGGRLPAPALRYVSVGGAPLDPTLKRRVEALWGLPLHNGYGLTETAPTVSITDIDRPAEDDSVGLLLPGVEARIVDPGSGSELGPDAVGEIWIRGPNVMRGYYRDPEQTAAVLTPEGWLKTGDLARLDAGGNLYIVGRLKELIIRSGFNVYPAEVEAVLAGHPDVALCAVVGRRSGGNEEVVAFVQPVAGRKPDIEGLRTLAAERLAPYKRPARYLVRETLPTTPAGKLLKAELREAAAALPEGE